MNAFQNTHPPQAHFITFEGLDGSGKTTLLDTLFEELQKQHIPVLKTREPGGTPFAEEIRKLILDPRVKTSARSELLLFQAARAHHVDTLIRPQLAQGVSILCDRFTDSSIAYQSSGRTLPLEMVLQSNLWSTQGLQPDLTIFVDTPLAIAAQRAEQRGQKNHLDAETIDFRQRLQAAYQELARAHQERFLVVDGSGAPHSLVQAVMQNPRWRALWPSP